LKKSVNVATANGGLYPASVTIVIVNWNSGPLLQRCLSKLQAQTLKPQKIFVVDNASTDGSVEAITLDSNVSLLKCDSNLGFAGGNNYAFNHIDTEFIALLNPDAFPECDWLECLVAAANAYPEAAAFGSCQLMCENPELLDGYGDAYHISGLVWREEHGKKRGYSATSFCKIFPPCAAAALYRREALVEMGGFDEDYFCYVEDVDLGFRLRLAGYQSLYVADALVYHLGSATTGGQQSDFSIYHGHRNLVWTFVKNMPGILFWMLLPFHLTLNIVSIGFFIIRGRSKVILRAKWDAIKGLPGMWYKRKQIQKNRVASINDIWELLDKSLIKR